MDRVSYEVLGNTQGNRSEDVVQPTPGRVFPLVFMVGLLGIFLLVNLRRALIIDFRLPWPSSTATGMLSMIIIKQPVFMSSMHEKRWQVLPLLDLLDIASAHYLPLKNLYLVQMLRSTA